MRIKIIIFCWYCIQAADSAFNDFNYLKFSPNSSTKRLISDARRLVETCLINNSNPAIITSDLIEDGNKLQNPGDANGINPPVIVINDELKGDRVKGYVPTYPTYVLSFESIEKLEAQAKEFRSSAIWSVKSPFLVLDSNKESLCSNAGKVLGILWTMDLLSAYYLCYDVSNDSTIVYTLNPFTNYAPRPWAKVEAANQFDNKGKKWTLYNRQYSKVTDRTPCKNICFEKTQELDGHEIKLFGHASNSQKDDNIRTRGHKIVDSFADEKLVSLLGWSRYINAQRVIYFLPLSAMNTIAEEGYIAELANKKLDAHVKLLQLADTNYKFSDFITQYLERRYSILTKKSNYLTAISEITYNLQFIISTIVVLLLIAVIMIVNNKFDISGGIMDVIKMSAGMGVMSPFDRLSTRIIYLSGFLFIFTVMPEFQGQISAILSKPMRRNVESLKDLYENKFHVYYDKLLENDIINENLWVTDEDKKYLHPLDQLELFDCSLKVQKDPLISCIFFTWHHLQVASKSKYLILYVSKKVTFKKYYVYWTRKDWAVKQKLDKIASLFVESGLIHYGIEKVNEYSKKVKKLDKIEQQRNFDQIDFDHLVISYMFTGAIVLWGLFIFGIEVLFHKHSKICRQIKMRRYFRKNISVRSQPRIIFFPGRMVLLNNRNQA
ncbi:uncharacterized protein LOC130674378 [Microplitis mediator]|uniref:uncharacterized protein LOC130674378 n=1 Tax=Microplitis mediator TaxID=375433 RepID=UPI0025564CA8|nr:uncharacterized protein LOC130674378 [Microplitis mediator]